MLPADKALLAAQMSKRGAIQRLELHRKYTTALEDQILEICKRKTAEQIQRGIFDLRTTILQRRAGK